MNGVDATPGPILNLSLTDATSATWVRALAFALAVALTAAAAQFTVPLPFTAVPFVLTPLVVLLSGAALGSRLCGFLSQALYLALGATSVAVFRAVGDVAAGPPAPRRTDRRISDGLSRRGLRHGSARRTRLGSRLFFVGRSDAGRPRDHLRGRGVMALDLDDTFARGGREGGRAAVRRLRRRERSRPRP